MFWAIAGIVVVCAICSMAGSAADKSEAQQSQLADQRAAQTKANNARRIEVFQKLLKEEFPDIADDFSLATVTNMLSARETAANSKEVKSRRAFFNKANFKSDADAKWVTDYVIERFIRAGPESLVEKIFGGDSASKENAEALMKFFNAYNASDKLNA